MSQSDHLETPAVETPPAEAPTEDNGLSNIPAQVEFLDTNANREASTVPEFETDPDKSRFSLRKAPEEVAPLVREGESFQERAARRKSRKSVQDSEASLVKVELVSGGDLGARVDIAGYGSAPRVIEVFPSEDFDSVIEADDLEQIELNIETEAQQQILNFDLSSEYQQPRLDRALEYRKLHMPTKPDGSLLPIWGTRTGRFVFKRCSWLDCFREGRKSDLIAFGPGVSGYFKFLKSLGTLFFFLCLFSLPFLVVNVNGGTHFSRHPFPFAQTTLGNLYVQFNKTQYLLSTNLTTLEALNQTIQDGEYVTYTLRLPAFCSGIEEGCRFKRTDLLLAYSIWDAAICLLIVFAVNVMMYFTRHETIMYKQKIPKIEDYSLETTVPANADAKSLQMHFESILQRIEASVPAVANVYEPSAVSKQSEMFDQVFDVQIVESTGNAISLCIRRGFLLKKLARLDAKIKVMRKRGISQQRITPYEKRHEKVRQAIQQLDERAISRAEKGKALMAFVTFETQEARARILHEYDVFWVCGNQPEHLKFQGKDVVRVKPAPPPSTLLWENQEISILNRLFRLFFALILLVATLGITAGLSFATDSNRVFTEVLDVVSGESYVRCGGKYDNATTLAEAASLANANGDVSCFCDYEAFAPRPATAEENGFLFIPGGFCANHVLSKIASIGKEIGLSFVILIINLLIFKIVLVTAEFMKFKNAVDREFAVLRAIFLITFINTALISLLVNTNWSALLGVEIDDVVLADGTKLVQIGRFVDFEPGWYSRVGVELFIISLLNIIAPHVLPTMRYIYHVIERKYFAPFAVSQQVLNEMYIGEDFLLSVRLAQTLMMVFFTLLFSSGMPILYFSGLVCIIVSYWFDKFYFVRLVRTPPQFDTALQLWTVRAIEWAVIFHCLFGFWMYSSPRLFPLTDEEAKQSLLADLQQNLQLNINDNETVSAEVLFVNEFSSRLVRGESIIMLCCAALVSAMKFLRRFGRTAMSCASPMHFLMNMIRACCGREHQLRRLNKYIVHAETFEDALKHGHVAGVRSYNILANPVYQRVFQMQDGFGDEREKSTDSASSASKTKPGADGSGVTGSYRGFQSLQEALNIRKGTAVSSIEARSIWRDDNRTGSVRSNKSNNTTTQLYQRKSKDDQATVNPQHVKSSASVVSDADDAASTARTVSTRSAKKTVDATVGTFVEEQPLTPGAEKDEANKE